MIDSTRSTPLRPAVWMTGVLVSATVIALFLRVPTWAGIFLCSLTAASFLIYVALYGYLLRQDRESPGRERIESMDERAVEGGSLSTDHAAAARRDEALQRAR